MELLLIVILHQSCGKSLNSFFYRFFLFLFSLLHVAFANGLLHRAVPHDQKKEDFLRIHLRLASTCGRSNVQAAKVTRNEFDGKKLLCTHSLHRRNGSICSPQTLDDFSIRPAIVIIIFIFPFFFCSSAQAHSLHSNRE